MYISTAIFPTGHQSAFHVAHIILP